MQTTNKYTNKHTNKQTVRTRLFHKQTHKQTDRQDTDNRKTGTHKQTNKQTNVITYTKQTDNLLSRRRSARILWHCQTMQSDAFLRSRSRSRTRNRRLQPGTGLNWDHVQPFQWTMCKCGQSCHDPPLRLKIRWLDFVRQPLSCDRPIQQQPPASRTWTLLSAQVHTSDRTF